MPPMKQKVTVFAGAVVVDACWLVVKKAAVDVSGDAVVVRRKVEAAAVVAVLAVVDSLAVVVSLAALVAGEVVVSGYE